MRRTGRFFAPGAAEGIALVLAEPLSFWGGIDATAGTIVDRSHPDCGKNVSGRVVVMPGARGSSSSSSVLAESIRLRTAPAAIILGRADPILTVGAIVAEALYGLRCPIVQCTIDEIVSGARIRIAQGSDGEATIVIGSD